MVYRFGDYELDAERFELRANAVNVRVEPRVFETVAYLVRNRQRVVTKDELIDNVWKVKVVSDSALARCVMEARRALGGENGHLWIQTVHGRGWRFVAPTDEIPDVPHPPTVATAAQPDAPTTVVGTGDRWLSARWRIAVVILGLFVVTGAWMLFAGPGSDDPAPARPAIALLPISVQDPDSETEMLALSITDLLAVRLSRIPSLLLREAETTGASSLEASSLAGLAEQLGVRHVLTGTLNRVGGDKAHLDLTLVEIVSPRSARALPLGAYDLPLPATTSRVSEYAQVRDSIVRELTSTLLPALELAPDPKSAPHSIEAYRFYLLAKGQMATGNASGETAVRLLDQSLRLDPDFAPGWTLYGWALYDLATFGGLDGSHYQQALDAAEKALALDPDSTQALVLKTTVMTEIGQVEDAYALLAPAADRFPQRAELPFFLSYTLRYAGCLEASRRALERAHALDPIVSTVYGGAPTAYLYLGDEERFVKALPGFSSPLYAFYRGLAAWRRGDHGEVARHLRPAFAMAPGDVFARLAEALLAVEEGRATDSRAILRQLALQRDRLGSGDGEVTFKIAQVFTLAGDHDSAAAALARAVDQGFFCPPCMSDRLVFAPLEGRDDFQRTLAVARTRHMAFVERFNLQGADATAPRRQRAPGT